MILRPEKPDDTATLHALTYAAFKPVPFSDDSEADTLDALRRDGDLLLSLVAEQEGQIIGHVAFSPVLIDGADMGWVALGPISVAPDRRKQGIARALIGEGLSRMRAAGAAGTALIGDPQVYAGSGFVAGGRLRYGDLPLEYIQHIHWNGPPPQGTLRFAPAFGAPH